MEIRHSDDRPYPAIIPTGGAPPIPSSRRSFHVPSPWASGEIIDYVEIRADSDQTTLRRQTPYPIRTDRSVQTKGRWIDIWI